jgi:hypothetical protein
MPLRRRLLVTLLGAWCGSLLLMASVVIAANGAQERDEARDRLRDMALVLRHQIEGFCFERLGDLRVISLQMQRTPEPEWRGLLRLARDTYGTYRSLRFVDQGGVVRIDTNQLNLGERDADAERLPLHAADAVQPVLWFIRDRRESTLATLARFVREVHRCLLYTSPSPRDH